eukprot:TRINITY_DN714_c0_g1_i2.p1 TRINITY_DN714_c0_g1~~TRINITY_DN714_c0_g1_i2.p1  ORF type:complete len:156 (-),score=59.19 TRINITY_DN714_c0_g1_i2:85-552(-)
MTTGRINQSLLQFSNSVNSVSEEVAHLSVETNIDNEAVEEHETMDTVSDKEKLMRTKSTQNVTHLPPQQKWQSLFKMYKEWKYQTNVAEASRLVVGGDPASVEEEIIKLRAAIYAMRQRKNLSKSDQRLFDQMNVKLKGLVKIAADLAEVKNKGT